MSYDVPRSLTLAGTDVPLLHIDQGGPVDHIHSLLSIEMSIKSQLMNCTRAAIARGETDADDPEIHLLRLQYRAAYTYRKLAQAQHAALQAEQELAKVGS
jgi:hypothetical protein